MIGSVGQTAGHELNSWFSVNVLKLILFLHVRHARLHVYCMRWPTACAAHVTHPTLLRWYGQKHALGTLRWKRR